MSTAARDPAAQAAPTVPIGSSNGASPADQANAAGTGVCEVRCFHPERIERARKALLSDSLALQLAELFKAVSHPTRIHILRALAEQELCVCDLAETVGSTVSAVSHQLAMLRHLGLVTYRTEGKLAYYSLQSTAVAALLEDGLDQVAGAKSRASNA